MKNISSKDLHARHVRTQKALSHLETKSDDTVATRRRHRHEVDFQMLDNPFIRDASVILSSKAWRRMGGKNQVASSPLTPYIRDRATHVAEVIAHSTRGADHLGLNAHLAHAIACGHDIGHVPFGHQGEQYLREKIGKPFTHEVMGVVVAQHIERKGRGLNCTFATLDGMYRHSGENASSDMTPEAWLVRYADKVAFLYGDYNDFERLCWQCQPELVKLMDWFGSSQRDRVNRTMIALYEESATEGHVSFEKSEAAFMFAKLRKLMYEEYYRIVEQNVERFLDPIYDFLDRSRRIPPWLGIALLTDQEVCRLVGEHRMINSKTIMDTGLGEIIRNVNREYLFGIDCMSLDLDWKQPAS